LFGCTVTGVFSHRFRCVCAVLGFAPSLACSATGSGVCLCVPYHVLHLHWRVQPQVQVRVVQAVCCCPHQHRCLRTSPAAALRAAGVPVRARHPMGAARTARYVPGCQPYNHYVLTHMHRPLSIASAGACIFRHCSAASLCEPLAS
jgi:hypothetical protein